MAEVKNSGLKLVMSCTPQKLQMFISPFLLGNLLKKQYHETVTAEENVQLQSEVPKKKVTFASAKENQTNQIQDFPEASLGREQYQISQTNANPECSLYGCNRCKGLFSAVDERMKHQLSCVANPFKSPCTYFACERKIYLQLFQTEDCLIDGCVHTLNMSKDDSFIDHFVKIRMPDIFDPSIFLRTSYTSQANAVEVVDDSSFLLEPSNNTLEDDTSKTSCTNYIEPSKPIEQIDPDQIQCIINKSIEYWKSDNIPTLTQPESKSSTFQNLSSGPRLLSNVDKNLNFLVEPSKSRVQSPFLQDGHLGYHSGGMAFSSNPSIPFSCNLFTDLLSSYASTHDENQQSLQTSIEECPTLQYLDLAKKDPLLGQNLGLTQMNCKDPFLINANVKDRLSALNQKTLSSARSCEYLQSPTLQFQDGNFFNFPSMLDEPTQLDYLDLATLDFLTNPNLINYGGGMFKEKADDIYSENTSADPDQIPVSDTTPRVDSSNLTNFLHGSDDTLKYSKRKVKSLNFKKSKHHLNRKTKDDISVKDTAYNKEQCQAVATVLSDKALALSQVSENESQRSRDSFDKERASRQTAALCKQGTVKVSRKRKFSLNETSTNFYSGNVSMDKKIKDSQRICPPNRIFNVREKLIGFTEEEKDAMKAVIGQTSCVFVKKQKMLPSQEPILLVKDLNNMGLQNSMTVMPMDSMSVKPIESVPIDSIDSLPVKSIDSVFFKSNDSKSCESPLLNVNNHCTSALVLEGFNDKANIKLHAHCTSANNLTSVLILKCQESECSFTCPSVVELKHHCEETHSFNKSKAVENGFHGNSFDRNTNGGSPQKKSDEEVAFSAEVLSSLMGGNTSCKNINSSETDIITINNSSNIVQESKSAHISFQSERRKYDTVPYSLPTQALHYSKNSAFMNITTLCDQENELVAENVVDRTSVSDLAEIGHRVQLSHVVSPCITPLVNNSLGQGHDSENCEEVIIIEITEQDQEINASHGIAVQDQCTSLQGSTNLQLGMHGRDIDAILQLGRHLQPVAQLDPALPQLERVLQQNNPLQLDTYFHQEAHLPLEPQVQPDRQLQIESHVQPETQLPQDTPVQQKTVSQSDTFLNQLDSQSYKYTHVQKNPYLHMTTQQDSVLKHNTCLHVASDLQINKCLRKNTLFHCNPVSEICTSAQQGHVLQHSNLLLDMIVPSEAAMQKITNQIRIDKSVETMPDDSLLNKAVHMRCPPEIDTSNKSSSLTLPINAGKPDPVCYPCEKCDYKASKKMYLQQHMAKHEGVYFYCDIENCEFKTFYRRNLETHKIKHTGLKRFLCDQCLYTTYEVASLRRHWQLKHGVEKKFKCPNCEYVSLFRIDVAKHFRNTHLQQKLYACNQCEYRTGYTHLLKYHLMAHAGIRPYKCSACDYQVNNHNKVMRHIKTRHAQESGITCEKLDLTFEIDAKQFQCEEKISDLEIGVIELTDETMKFHKVESEKTQKQLKEHKVQVKQCTSNSVQKMISILDFSKISVLKEKI